MQTAQFQLHAEIEQKHWWFVARRQIIRQIVGAVLPASAESGILDVGCGTGGNIADLAADYPCLGIDTSVEAIAFARQRFSGVRFICGTAPSDVLEFLPQIRLILLMDVLEHVADDKALLRHLVSAAEPGAYFLITVPANPKLWSGHDVAFGHYRRYETKTFEELWRDLPLRPLLVSHFNSRLCPLVKAVRAMNRRRGKALGAAGTDFRMPKPLANRALRRVFAGESRRLIKTLRNRGAGYRRGVSLISLLQRPPQSEFSGSSDVGRHALATLCSSNH